MAARIPAVKTEGRSENRTTRRARMKFTKKMHKKTNDSRWDALTWPDKNGKTN